MEYHQHLLKRMDIGLLATTKVFEVKCSFWDWLHSSILATPSKDVYCGNRL